MIGGGQRVLLLGKGPLTMLKDLTENCAAFSTIALISVILELQMHSAWPTPTSHAAGCHSPKNRVRSLSGAYSLALDSLNCVLAAEHTGNRQWPSSLINVSSGVYIFCRLAAGNSPGNCKYGKAASGHEQGAIGVPCNEAHGTVNIVS